ncbi:hypothetical protein HYU14_02690 [Candidatus Woesearchaeota archaeon]|nr:hypothetical protein [Candidatus Woesearchaeota archaeon]
MDIGKFKDPDSMEGWILTLVATAVITGIIVLSLKSAGVTGEGSGQFSGAFKIVGTLIGGLVMLAVIVVMLMSIGKGEAKEKAKRGFMDDLSYNIKEFTKNLHRLDWGVIRWFIQQWGLKYTTNAGGTTDEELNPTIRQLWALFWANMNYMLRLEVYFGKANYVSGKSKEISQIYTTTYTEEKDEGGTALAYYDPRRVELRYDILKWGWKYDNKNFGESIDLLPRKEGYYVENNGDFLNNQSFQTLYGGMANHIVILTFFSNIKKFLTPPSAGGASDKHIFMDLKMGEKRNEGDLIREMNGNLLAFQGPKGTAEKRYPGEFKRYSGHNQLKNARLIIFNQYLMFGKFCHFYKFARAGATKYKVTYTVKKEGSDVFYTIKISGEHEEGVVGNKSQRDPDRYKIGNILDYEVDLDGYFIKQLNQIRYSGDETIPLYRIKPVEYIIVGGKRVIINNIIDHPDMTIPLATMERDWHYFVRDVIHGTFHPHSLLAISYEELLDRKSIIFKDIHQAGEAQDGNPAFDLEALKDSGKFIYWGIKDIGKVEESLIKNEPANPYPTLTTSGISAFVGSYLSHFADQFGKAQAGKFIWGGPTSKEVFVGAPAKTKTEGGHS